MKIEKGKLYNGLVYFVLFWIVVQDFILPILYKISGSSTFVNILFYSKDVLLIVMFVWAFFESKLSRSDFFIIILYFACVLIGIISTISKGSIGLMSVLQNVRNIILLPCFFCIGYGVMDRKNFRECLEPFFFRFVVICAVLGLIEYALDALVGTMDFWRETIGFTAYYVDIKKQGAKMLFGLPGNFYGSYGQGYFAVKRLVSLWGNPLTSAYVMFVPAIYYLLTIYTTRGSKVSRMKAIMSFLILAVAIYYTHTRAIILLLLAFGAYLIVKEPKNRKVILMCGGVLGSIFFILNFQSLVRFLYDGSTAGHIEAIVFSLQNIQYKLFGNGLGYAGTSGVIGTENSYITLLANIGILGCLIYIIILLKPLLRIYRKSVKEFDVLQMTVLYSGVCYAITGVVSEQLFAYTTIAPFFLLLGFAYKTTKIVEE